jgi:hypothetical protein
MAVTSGFTADYWQVEHALAQTFAIAASNLPKFRSRIGELQRGGLFGAKNQPGKGAKLVYGPEQFHRLVFAISMAQFGLAPTVILRLVRDYWTTHLDAMFWDATRMFGRSDENSAQDDDIVLVLGIRIVSEGAAEAIPTINSCTLRKLPARVELTLQDDEPRLVINLTERMRKFHAALRAVHLTKEPKQRAKE